MTRAWCPHAHYIPMTACKLESASQMPMTGASDASSARRSRGGHRHCTQGGVHTIEKNRARIKGYHPRDRVAESLPALRAPTDGVPHTVRLLGGDLATRGARPDRQASQWHWRDQGSGRTDDGLCPRCRRRWARSACIPWLHNGPRAATSPRSARVVMRNRRAAALPPAVPRRRAQCRMVP